MRVLQRVRRPLGARPDSGRAPARVDRLADLGTGIVTLSGGEPLLHPDLDAIVRPHSPRGVIATLITNGYLLTPRPDPRLNRAGLDHLQISIDNVHAGRRVEEEPEGARPEAADGWRSDAEFDVTVNSVVGGGDSDIRKMR